jgi:hypothetical protein
VTIRRAPLLLALLFAVFVIAANAWLAPSRPPEREREGSRYDQKANEGSARAPGPTWATIETTEAPDQSRQSQANAKKAESQHPTYGWPFVLAVSTAFIGFLQLVTYAIQAYARCARLENRQGASSRGFESPSIREISIGLVRR